MPNLLVAPKAPHMLEQNDDSSALDDSRGYYADGAYTAAPTLGPSLPPQRTTAAPSDDDEQDPQDAYYARLRLRFSLLRATLRCVPPATHIRALDDSHPISLPLGSRKAFATWRYLLQTTDPVPAQLASLDQGSVLRVLGIVTKEMKRGRAVGRRGGAWVWGLLGRCREVGECGSEEVGVLRELGKRAVWVLMEFREGGRDTRREGEGGGGGAEDEEEEDGYGRDDDAAQDPARSKSPNLLRTLDVETRVEIALPNEADAIPAPLTDDTPSNGLDTAPQAPEQSTLDTELLPSSPHIEPKSSNSDNHETEANDLELAAAKERIRARLEESADSIHDREDEASEAEAVTFATLDMILTVVGEFYGQRDLLEFRDLWDEMG